MGVLGPIQHHKAAQGEATVCDGNAVNVTKTITGHKTQHCTVCHQTFTGPSSGDKHRTGKHGVTCGPDRRRCLTVDEMTARGMKRNGHGYWTLGGTSPWARKK